MSRDPEAFLEGMLFSAYQLELPKDADDHGQHVICFAIASVLAERKFEKWKGKSFALWAAYHRQCAVNVPERTVGVLYGISKP